VTHQEPEVAKEPSCDQDSEPYAAMEPPLHPSHVTFSDFKEPHSGVHRAKSTKKEEKKSKVDQDEYLGSRQRPDADHPSIAVEASTSEHSEIEKNKQPRKSQVKERKVGSTDATVDKRVRRVKGSAVILNAGMINQASIASKNDGLKVGIV
jgi:hypothetical protein